MGKKLNEWINILCEQYFNYKKHSSWFTFPHMQLPYTFVKVKSKHRVLIKALIIRESIPTNLEKDATKCNRF